MKIVLSLNYRHFKITPSKLIELLKEYDKNNIIKGFEISIKYYSDRIYIERLAKICKSEGYLLRLHAPTLMEPYKYEEYFDFVNKIAQIYGNKINKQLDLIGIGTHLHGRKYLCDAIYFIIQNDKNCKISIVQYLVNKYKKSNSTISRAMQNAILHAWRITPLDDLTTYYTARINYETGVPTPTELIYYYADKIKKEV